ncbi:hypothetical protein H3L93_06185 [Kingella oralis]|uniref:Uncharacterized protein n=1 Tax=Kingella oralis ATCC 51147 TaxID=629741 RepID=C4GGB1_9NEIS|nr:hypothetical protein GCWU000324_01179 [Kingella oralis ATCC 51147]QMT43901.1 hypothetical protein H3L93_06185 [Kingella oralis]
MQNLQAIECRWLADIFPISQALLNKTFGDEPLPLHFSFQAALSPENRQPEKHFSVSGCR